MQIVLLISTTDRIEESNYLRLGNELLQRGATVTCAFMDSIAMMGSEVVVQGFDLKQPLVVNDIFPTPHRVSLGQADVVWILSLGMRHSFLDKVQLLHCLQDQCRLVNSLESLMHFKSKYFLATHGEVFQYPETYTSTSPIELAKIITDSGGSWIAKPPAGSLGKDVFLLEPEDPNLSVILESMTGPDADQYCLIQTYVPEIRQGEKRVLLANGVPVGQYLRQAGDGHRTNVTAGARTSICDLTQKEQAYCERIGEFLAERGALFVGLDLAYPWVIEFNVVNPGGIQTILDLGGDDLSARIIDEIFPETAHLT